MASIIRRLRREPLVGFLAAGLLLFALHAMLSTGTNDADSRVIRVDRDGLLRFMQQRARSFNESGAAARLETMAPDEVATMVDDMVREEAEYREALRLGLDTNDYVMRRRLVQSLEYMVEGGMADRTQPDDAALKRYYEENRPRYSTRPAVTFSHVYFSADRYGWPSAERRAVDAQETLGAVEDASQAAAGDRFLYLKNYTDRNPELIEDHFGKAFAAELSKLKADETRWQGPLRSEHGYHLVQILAKDDGHSLSFAVAKAMVAEDAAKGAADRRRNAFVADLLRQYHVDLGGDVRSLMATAK